MSIKQLGWATGPVLLMLLASLADTEGCTQLPYTYEEPKCKQGETMIFEIRYPDGQNSGWCCPPGGSMIKEKELRTRATACRSTKCAKVGIANPCEGTLEKDAGAYWVNGEKVIYEEVKREKGCLTKKGNPGETTYCCKKGSLDSSLEPMFGAEINEFPHMALLSINNGRCGGTIYNKRHIITAGHCVIDIHGTKLPAQLNEDSTVKVGRNLAKTPMPENDYKIVRVIPHPEFSMMAGHPELKIHQQIYNDIAFLEVDRDIKFGPNVKSLQIAPKGFDELNSADNAVCVGWGTTDLGSASDNLLNINLLIRKDDVCFGQGGNAQYPHQFERFEKLLCLGGIKEGIWSASAGQGDSGGPGICRGTDGSPILCGLVSGGGNTTLCEEKNDEKNCWPNFFTEVDYFVDWINQTAGEQDPTTFYKGKLFGDVVSGKKVEHQVRITSASGKPCGGTLIAPDTVVTAAHCIASGDGKMLSGLEVWSEVQDISSSGSQGKSNGVKSITTLDGFKMVGAPVDIAAQGMRVSRTDNLYSNNLGVIKLKEPVNISPANLPKLPEAGELASTPALEFAFPRNTSRGGELRQREYSILDNGECQRRVDLLEHLKMNSKVEDNILCGVEKYSGGSICDRELGGGLICKGNNGRDTLCGVQVHRYCEFSIPNYFINVGLNSGWIEAAKNQL